MPQSQSTVKGSYDTLDGLGKQASPAVPASTVALANPFTFACLVRVRTGTVTVIAVGGVTYATATGALVYVDVGESIAITYSVVPAWDWFGVPGK
jgi:hypothetical protein